MEVENDLYSYSEENALAANCGRELREMIEQVDADQGLLENRVTSLENNTGSSTNGCQTKIWTTAIM